MIIPIIQVMDTMACIRKKITMKRRIVINPSNIERKEMTIIIGGNIQKNLTKMLILGKNIDNDHNLSINLVR